MGRFFNRECGFLLVGVLAGIFGLCLLAGYPLAKAALWSVGLALVSFLPLAVVLQDFLIQWYSDHGKVERALDHAIAIRDSTSAPKAKNTALVDVALLMLVKRDFRNALNNLEKVRVNLLKEAEPRAVVDGHVAYALAHLGEHLERAEELARSAARAVPAEPLFGYYLGLVLFKRGQLAEAEKLVAESLEKNPDPKAPFALNERTEALTQIREAKSKSA